MVKMIAMYFNMMTMIDDNDDNDDDDDDDNFSQQLTSVAAFTDNFLFAMLQVQLFHISLSVVQHISMWYYYIVIGVNSIIRIPYLIISGTAC